MSETRWTVTEVANRLTEKLGRPVGPREITALIYDRRIPIALAPLVAGRRMLGEAAIALLEGILGDRAKPRGGDDGDQPGG